MKTGLSINRSVARDLMEILEHYENESGTALADDFYDELMKRFDDAAEHPEHFPFSKGDRRRVNLRCFPYHLIYRIKPDCIRILVLRHNKRNPEFGMRRQ